MFFSRVSLVLHDILYIRLRIRYEWVHAHMGACIPGLQRGVAEADGGASDPDVVLLLLGNDVSVAIDRANVVEGIRCCPLY